MLKAGARAYDKNLSNGNTAQVKWTSICQYCKGSNDSKEMTKCFFCEKDICVYCYNFCFKCEQHFCPLCSIIRYKANLFFLVFFFVCYAYSLSMFPFIAVIMIIKRNHIVCHVTIQLKCKCYTWLSSYYKCLDYTGTVIKEWIFLFI